MTTYSFTEFAPFLLSKPKQKTYFLFLLNIIGNKFVVKEGICETKCKVNLNIDVSIILNHFERGEGYGQGRKR